MSIQVTQWKLPLSIVSNGESTSNAWKNADNIKLVDDLVTESDVTLGAASDLTVGNFNFGIEQGDVVTGIEVMAIGYVAGITSPLTTLTPYAVDNLSGENLEYVGTPISDFTTSTTEKTIGGETDLFNTDWTVDQINNFKLKLMANGALSLDAVLVRVYYYTPDVITPDDEDTENCEDCNSQIEAQPFYLSRDFQADDRYAYLKSFNYPDGTPIEMEDLGACGGFVFLTFDEGKPKIQGSDFQESAKSASWQVQSNGDIQLDFGEDLENRGLGFKPPYDHTDALLSNHAANTKVILSNSAAFTNLFLKKCHIGILVSAPVTVSDENSELVDPAENIDFRGAGVLVVNDITDPNKKIVTIPGAGGSIPPSVGTTSTATSGETEVDEITFEVTNTGINRGTLLRFSISDSATPTAVTVGGDAATQIKTFNADGKKLETWLLIAPLIGTQEVVITLDIPSFIVASATPLFNMAQSSPVGTDSDDNGTGTAATTTNTTSQDYSLIFDLISTQDAPIVYTVGAGQSQDWQLTAVTDAIQGAGSYQPAGLTPDAVVMEWTLSKSATWAMTSVEIKGITSTVPGSGQSAIQFEDETGANLGVAGTADEFEITGPSVTGTRVGDKVTYTIAAPSGSSLEVQKDGSTIETAVDTINITGNANVTNPSAGQVDIDILAGGSGGGTKLAIDTTQQVASVGGTASYTVSIPGGTLGTNDAIRWRVLIASLNTNGGGTSSYAVRMSYGGTLIATGEIFNPALTGTGAFVDGIIVADNDGHDGAQFQKGQVSWFGGLITNTTNTRANSEYGTANVDSSVDQDLLIEFQSADNDQILTCEGVIVEKITTGGDSSKKVGVGDSSNTQWFNIQLPFISQTSAQSYFDLNVSTFGPMGATPGNGGSVTTHTGDDITSLFYNFEDSDTLSFGNTTKKKIIVEGVISATTDNFNAGWGIAPGTAGTIIAGTIDLGVGFVRRTGVWNAYAGDGAAATLTPVTISESGGGDKHVLRVEFDPLTPEARYYIDGVLSATITTNLPLTDATPIGFACGNDNNSPIGVIGSPSFAIEL